MNTFIKPCPFCGSEAGIWTREGRLGTYAIVKCEMCNASSGAVQSYLDANENGFEDSATFYAVLRKWNTRAVGDSEPTTNIIRCEDCLFYNPDLELCYRLAERAVELPMAPEDFCSFWAGRWR